MEKVLELMNPIIQQTSSVFWHPRPWAADLKELRDSRKGGWLPNAAVDAEGPLLGFACLVLGLSESENPEKDTWQLSY